MRGVIHVFGILFSLVASHALAQTTTVPVRSGEHADFTRLVIQIPEENSWRVSTSAMQARLLIEGPPLRFDISQSFARIPRTRLRSLDASENLLDLQLACACEIRAYEDIPQFLVIDILGASQPENRAMPETTRPPPRPAHLLRDPATGTPVSRRAGILLAQDKRALPADRSGPVSLTLLGVLGGDHADRLPAQEAGQPASDMPTPATVTAELGQIIARTVAQGVLLPADQDTGTRNPGSDAAGQDRVLPLSDLDAHLSLPGIAGASDRTAAGGMTDPFCLKLAQLTRTDLYSDPAIPAHPQTVSALYNELDMLDRAATIALAFDYISLGFGAEARLVASLLGPDDPLSAPIRAVAEIVDDDDAAPAAIAGLGDCGPAGSIWAFLGAPAAAAADETRFESVFQGFDSLPRPLRLHLGPRLVHKFLAAGMTSEAHRVRAATERVSDVKGKEMQLANVALALAEAPPPEQVRRLEASLSPEISDDMLRFLLDRREAEHAPVEPDLVALAENRLIALRGTPQGQQLAELTIRAMARNGDFHAAFALAGSDITSLSAQARDKLRDDLLEMLSDQATDADFVILVFEERPWDQSALSLARAQQLAERLTSLGFDEQAALLQHHSGQRSGSEAAEQGPGTEAASGTENSPDFATARSTAEDPERTALPTGSADAPQRPAGPVADPAAESDGALAQQSDTATGNDATAVPPRTDAPAPAQTDPAAVQDDRAGQPEVTPTPGVLDQSRALLSESSDFRSRLQMLLDESTE